MQNKGITFLISMLLSAVLILESGISVAALPSVDSGEELGTPENLEAVTDMLNIVDSNGENLELDELDEDEYDGFIYSVKDNASRSGIRKMENEIDGLSGKSEVEEVVSNELYSADSLETISEVASADMIETIEPNYINTLSVYSSTPNDRFYNKCLYTMVDEYGNTDGETYDSAYKNILGMMNVQKVWERGFFGSNDVTVAVIDSGVNANHEELGGKIKENLIVHNDVVSAFDNKDQMFHGTFASGIICAENNNRVGISGAMPNVKIVSLKIFFKGDDGEYVATNSDIAAAINYAVKKKVDVINMSFGQENKSDIVKSACDAAVNNGIILVAASGNNSTKLKRVVSQYPAAYDSVISVGSVNASTSKRSVFSNVNVDVVAPGELCNEVGYIGLNNDGKSNTYIFGKGTSFASPQVAALAAMAKSIDKDITVKEFKSILYATSKDLGTKGKDYEYGYGLVDYEGVLNELVGENGTAKEEVVDEPEDDPEDNPGDVPEGDDPAEGGEDDETGEITADNSEITLEYTSATYSGSEKEPEVTLVVNGAMLVGGQDYTVHYSDNVSVGTAVVTLRGINNYSGKIIKTFSIKPKGVSIKSLKSGKTAINVKWTAKKSSMEVTRADGVVSKKLTGYQIQVARNSSFTSGLKKATVKGYAKAAKTMSKLKRKKKYYVRIRTYLKDGSKTYYSKWSEVKSVKTK